MYCRKCGKWIPDDSNYCNYCGNKITLDKKEKRAIWLLVLFIILCLIASYFPIRYLWKLKYPAPLDYEKLSQSVVKINTYSGKWKCTVCGFENSVTKKISYRGFINEPLPRIKALPCCN